MGDVIPFRKSEPAPHATGHAFCLGCKHEWIAVAEVGATTFECPSCQAHKGHWKFEFYPSEGTMIGVCNCGNELFYLTTEGHMCANCGTYQEY